MSRGYGVHTIAISTGNNASHSLWEMLFQSGIDLLWNRGRQLCTVSREISSNYHVFINQEIFYSNRGKNLEDMNKTALLAAKYVSGYYKWRGSLWDHFLLHNAINFVLSQFYVRMNVSSGLHWGSLFCFPLNICIFFFPWENVHCLAKNVDTQA